MTQQGEIRLLEGSYSEKAQELKLELKENAGDDACILQGGHDSGKAPEQLPDGIMEK